MSKGAQTATSTTTNPNQVAQAPYLKQGYEQAQDLYKNNPLTPYSNVAPTLATAGTAERTRGYQDLYNAGQNVQGLNPQVYNAYSNALGANGASNPAYGGYQAFAEGNAAPQQNFQNLQNWGLTGGTNYGQAIAGYSVPMGTLTNAAAANNNLGLSQLGNTASGAYLNSNPYINAAIQAAQDPVARNYQTSIAPTMDAALASSGRYGSGAQAGLYDASQQSLTKGLGDISTNMMNANYQAERGRQDAAAQNYGSLYNAGIGLGMQGLTNAANIQGQAGNQYFEGLRQAQNAAQQQLTSQQGGLSGLAGLWNQGTANQLNALGQYPALAQGMGTGARMGAEAGTGLSAIEQAIINDQKAKWEAGIQQPYAQQDKYMGYIGAPVAGSESKSTPYYSNPIAGIGALASGIGGLVTAFSDRRLKEDDQVVGQLGDLPIHTFKYKGGDATHIGFMADEVDPKAVVDHPSGYKAVDYNKAMSSALNSFRKR